MSEESAVVRLSGELARNFTSQRGIDPAEALAAHIARFWEPRMQDELLAHVASSDSSLDPLVVEAAARLPRIPDSDRAPSWS